MAADDDLADAERQSSYVIFADESGDHGLTNLRSHSRAFVIAFAIFRREEYERVAIPTFTEYKRRFFGDESAPLHERDIHRGEGAFRRLRGAHRRAEAEEQLRHILERLPFAIVAVGIRKDRFIAGPDRPGSPYERRFVEALVAYLLTMPEADTRSLPTEIVVDSRGKREDAQLLDLVNALTKDGDPETASFRFQIRFTKKADAEVGVEVADLIANPIARRVLNEEHPLIPFRLLEPKFLRHPTDASRFSLIVLGAE